MYTFEIINRRKKTLILKYVIVTNVKLFFISETLRKRSELVGQMKSFINK